MRRRVLFPVLALVCTTLALELLSLVFHPLLLGRAFSPSAFAEARRRVNELARDRSNLETLPNTGQPREQMDSAERMKVLVTIWQRSSIELARLAARNGIAYFHFLQPNQYDDGAKVMGPDERRLAFRDDHPYRAGARAGYPLLRAAGQTLRREGDFFHDFSRLFEDVTAPLFADDCCHLNQDGYNRVADAIADVVRISATR